MSIEDKGDDMLCGRENAIRGITIDFSGNITG